MIDVEQLSCQELVELVTDYLETALEPGDLQRFEEHVAVCGKCATYLEQMHQALRVTGALRDGGLTPEAELHLLGVFRSWAST